MARNSEDFAAQLVRISGRHEGTRARSGFNDDDAVDQTGDNAVSAWEVFIAGLEAGRPFGDEAALRADTCLQFGMLWGINPVDAARHDGDRAARQRCFVGSAIDAARQPGNDREARFGQFAGKQSRQLHAGSRALPRADNRDGRALQKLEVAFDVDHRRRRIDLRQKRGIIVLDCEARDCADTLCGFELAFRVGLRADTDGASGAAASRQGSAGRRGLSRRRRSG